jgi:hypothetical protein
MRDAVIVLVCMAALGFFWNEGRARRAQRASREANACRFQRDAIERAVAHWETVNGRLPTDRTLWFDVDDRGTIAFASTNLVSWCLRRAKPPTAQLLEGSDALAPGGRSYIEFGCPLYSGKPGWRSGQVYYRFVMEPRGISTPSSRWKTRGVICLMHGESGPADDPDAVHSLER